MLPGKAASYFRCMSGRLKSILGCVVLAAATCAGSLIATVPARAGLELGGEAIIIDDVNVGSVFYTANCGVSRPALPVTVVATFLTPEVPPKAFSPYAVGNWTGGYGGTGRTITSAIRIPSRCSISS
jgi:hypothetical protein